MQPVNLNGEWKLYYFPQADRILQSPDELQQSDISFVSAEVPGNVELDLVRAGKLPDPFVGNNIFQLKPYELYEWWYEKEFAAPPGVAGRKVELLFHGVDCIAEYWLNGRLIGSSDNMLIEHRFDITDVLDGGGNNQLFVRLKSSVLEAMEYPYDPAMSANYTNWESLWIRKAAHSYSWDIMPRAISAGIWRSVELLVHDEHEIIDMYIYTQGLDPERAHMRTYFELKTDPRIMHELTLELEGQCGDSSFRVEKKIYFVTGSFDFDIQSPRLWWPRNYGDASLYEVTIRLKHHGRCLAERKDQFGVRKAELIRTEITSKEHPGQFMFKVNDTPVWVKGSNWVPADAFHSRDADRYEPILELFRDLNCNMVRVWGGGVYEDHSFFDYCDRHGIMVWQDFAMACHSKPQTEAFWSKIREEARAVIRKLRKHASLVLWSGDNEIDQVIVGRKGMDPATNLISRSVLPQIVTQCDPIRPFLPSSPYYAPQVIALQDKDLMPEQHLWGARDYYKSNFYKETTAHFISEIGYHGCPNLSSIRKFIESDHLWPWQNNDQWITHATCMTGKDGLNAGRIKLMANQIHELFGEIPEKIEEFIIASQISQAEAKKFFIEMVRLKKPARTGVLWWNVMDGWPQFSDAIVDYYFGKKLAYHYIKRVQKPLCVMVDEPERWHVRAVVGNDSNTDFSGTYRIWDADSGESLLSGHFEAQANRNVEIGKIRVSSGEQRMLLIEWTANGTADSNHYLLGTPPFSLEKYRRWLRGIADLPCGFDWEQVGK